MVPSSSPAIGYPGYSFLVHRERRRAQRRQQQQQQEDSISDNNGYLAMSMVSITLVRYRYLKPSSQLIQQSARQRVGRREIDS